MTQRLHWFVIVYVLIYVGQSFDFRLLIIATVALSLFWFYMLHYPPWFICSLILFAVCIQYIVSDLDTEENRTPSPLSKMTIQGNITSMIEEKDSYLRFQLQMTDHSHKTDVYYFYQENNKEDVSAIRTGAYCTLTGEFQEIPTARNPGQFDYKHFLATQDITSQLIIESIRDINCQGASFLDAVYHIRYNILSSLQKDLSATTYSWFAALLFGDRTNLDDEIVTLFQNWQLSHLLAISGLHVGLILSLIYALLLYVFRFTLEKAYFTIVLLLPFYPFIAGGAPSVWRASLLALALVAFKKIPIRFSHTDALSVVFLALVFVDPSIFYSLAFQFSFLVTYAILFSKELLKDPSVSNSWVVLRISLVSMWIILPIQLHHFYEFQPLSVLVNLIVIPYFSIVVIPLLLSILLLSIHTPIRIFLDTLFQKIHGMFIEVITMVDQLFQWNWLVGSFPIYYYVPFYVLLVIFMICFEKGKNRKTFLSGCMMILLLIYISVQAYFNPYGCITVLDIGQGDAIVIELPYRKGVFMVDAGGTLDKDFSSLSADTYEQIIDPFLRSKGIESIDAIFLSHQDLDHIGSVSYIVDNYTVDQIVTSSYFDQEVLQEWQMSNPYIKHITVQGGEKITLKDQVFTVHSPNQDTLDPNENSLVISSEFGNKNWLFTGDIGVETERDLLRKNPTIQADILKVAHHGSDTSTDHAFLHHIDAAYGLISVGKHNRYGHPHQDVITNLNKEGMHVLRTDQHGAIIYQFTETKGTFSTYLPYSTVR